MPLRRNVRRSSPRAVRLACGTPSWKPSIASTGIGSADVGARSVTRLSDRAQSAQRSACTSPVSAPGVGVSWESSSIYITCPSGPASIRLRSMSWRSLRSFWLAEPARAA